MTGSCRVMRTSGSAYSTGVTERELGEDVVVLRYEDWLSRPREAFGLVLDGLGLSRSKQTLDYAERSATPLSPRGAVTLAPALRPLMNEVLIQADYTPEVW